MSDIEIIVEAIDVIEVEDEGPQGPAGVAGPGVPEGGTEYVTINWHDNNVWPARPVGFTGIVRWIGPRLAAGVPPEIALQDEAAKYDEWRTTEEP